MRRERMRNAIQEKIAVRSKLTVCRIKARHGVGAREIPAEWM